MAASAAVTICSFHVAVVFAANPNDNGLLHQELVDFEYSVEVQQVPILYIDCGLLAFASM